MAWRVLSKDDIAYGWPIIEEIDISADWKVVAAATPECISGPIPNVPSDKGWITVETISQDVTGKAEFRVMLNVRNGEVRSSVLLGIVIIREQGTNLSRVMFVPNPEPLVERNSVDSMHIFLYVKDLYIKKLNRSVGAGRGAPDDKAPKLAANKRGRKSEYTQEERDELVEGWFRVQSDPKDVRTLPVYLLNEKGARNPDSWDEKPIVSKSRFYNWRMDYLSRKKIRVQ